MLTESRLAQKHVFSSVSFESSSALLSAQSESAQ